MFYHFVVSDEELQVSDRLWRQLEGPKPAAGYASNGCTNSPDRYHTITGVTYKLWPACVIHDYHYESGGNWKARQRADAVFRRNMVKQLALQGAGRARQQSLGWLYWGRVRIWGRSHYRWDEGEKPRGRWQLFREAYGLFRDNGH